MPWIDTCTFDCLDPILQNGIIKSTGGLNPRAVLKFKLQVRLFKSDQICYVRLNNAI